MPHARHHHSQLMLLAVFYRIFITHWTAGLYKRSNAGCMAQLYTIVEGEKGIAGHYSACKIKLKLARFFQCMTQGINTAGLSASFANELFIFYKCNGIWLQVFANQVRNSRSATYRKLIETGIEKDFSMGYGSINGFRASVCSPFYWYDLEKEEATSLMIYPFCFMDANSLFEQKQSPKQAYEELIQYYERVKNYKGVFIPIWHNFILGTDPLYKGWRELFELFMKETVYWDAYYDEMWGGCTNIYI